MPRKIKNADLSDRTSRGRLKARAKPYYQTLGRGLHLGYRKGKRDGQWVRRIYLGDGQYDTATFATADDRAESNGDTILTWDEAQDKARQLRDEFIRQRNGTPAEQDQITVAKACEDYIKDLRARKGETAAKDADGRLKKHLLPEFGDKLLSDLTTAELNGWRNGMVKEEGHEEEIRRSRDTANRVRSIAFAAFNLAFNTGLVRDDRSWRRVKPFKNVGEARKIIFSDEQQQNLIDACEPDLREFALLTARTGARPGRELTEAKVRDFDLEAKMLTVRGKTGEREIHLDADALRQLRRLASGKRPGDFLLTTAESGPWTKSLHQRPVAAAVEKAGLDPETTLYALRHTYISEALKKGVPVKAVADQCGTSIAMIQRYYAKFIPTDLARYARRAAPKLRDEPASDKVRQLRPAAA